MIRTVIPRNERDQSVVFGFGNPTGFGLRGRIERPNAFSKVSTVGTTPLLNVPNVTQPLRDRVIFWSFFHYYFRISGTKVAHFVKLMA